MEYNDTIEYNNEKRNANVTHLSVDLSTILIATVWKQTRHGTTHSSLQQSSVDATVSCVTSVVLFNCNVSRFLPQCSRESIRKYSTFHAAAFIISNLASPCTFSRYFFPAFVGFYQRSTVFDLMLG